MKKHVDCVQKIFTTLFVTILVACSSNQTDLTETQLSTGISVSTKSAEFGKAARAEEIKAMSDKLGSYFNGQHASNPEALMGEQTKANDWATITPKMVASNVATAVYRFFNTKTGAHFFTMSAIERDYVQTTLPFFNFEGISFFAYPDADSSMSPVYRFYNNVTGTHFFTISAAERDYVIATWPTIFSFEGTSWHASTTQQAGWVPVYRFFNTKTGAHFYTISAAERDNVIATLSWYNFEGIGYYVVDKSQEYGRHEYELVSINAGRFYDKTECVRDKDTGLIWQGMTAYDSTGTNLRENYRRITNYDSTSELQKWAYSYSRMGGTISAVEVENYVKPTAADINADTNISGFINAINASNLCGASNWRLPTTSELRSLLEYSNSDGYVKVNADWFSNTPQGFHWSSSTGSTVTYTAPAISLYGYVGGVSPAATEVYRWRDDQHSIHGNTYIRLVR
jgi:Protein of unknown function (DUF1566)/Repeat of unknown function (DUF5648)